ncbi:MAG: DNA polymerase I [candidate division WOR-3 bacterium]|nr:DNA polymerase I [candidate division WOR-3 bacterium]
MKRLLLIDGHSVIYRSFFAFIRAPLRNSKGFNTSAVFGFAQTLKRLLKNLKPDYCAVVYDAPGRTFRDEKFSEYKMQRPPAPEELPPQMPVVKEMVRAWGIVAFEVAGVEADDVLGTLARRFEHRGVEVTIATSDKDMLQLVRSGVSVYDPWKEKRFGPEDVKEKLGVGPELVPDLLALSGDDIDNIPGVPGVGPKRAKEILERWGSFEAAMAQDERVRGHVEIARLSRELAQIKTDVDVPAELDSLRPGVPDAAALQAIFTEMEFRGLAAEVAPAAEVNAEVQEFGGLNGLKNAGRFGVCLEPGRGLWVSSGPGMVALVRDSDTQRTLLSDSSLLKVGFDLKEQVRSAHLRGLDVRGPFFDVGVAAWLSDPNRHTFTPEEVTMQVLGSRVPPLSSGARAAHALTMFGALEPQLLAMGLGKVETELEMPLVPVLAAMEERGIKVDLAGLSRLETQLVQNLKAIERQVYQLAGHEFNIGSPKQLGVVLFEELKLARGKRTKTGYSTSVDVLNELAPKSEVVREVLKYRELTKLCNTYLEPLRLAARENTHRVHAAFNQTGTATGRLSSSDPNLQNIPIRTELGKRIRSAFVAEPGNVLVSADYSQIEMRVLAHLSGDEHLAEAFKRGEDIHASTAAAILRKDVADVKPEDRRLAKVVNYGLVYGMGDHGLSSRAEIPIEQARAFLDEYMARFAGVARWREQTIEQAKQSGYVRTISGRIRPTPGIADLNRAVAEATKRYAINAPVQGSAADIIKSAMLRLEERLSGGGFGIGMILQVHDELVFEVPEAKLEEAREMIRTEMENAWNLTVPLVVETGAGRTWGEAH